MRYCDNDRVAFNVPTKSFALLVAIAAALVLPVLAVGADDSEPRCRQLLPDDPDLRLGRVIGRGPVALLLDVPGCPAPAAACRGGGSVRPGDTLLLGASQRNYTCAFHAGSGGAGWIPEDRVAVRPDDPTPPPAAWAGTWRLYDDTIVLRQRVDGIEATGEAYWPAKTIMPANEGAFDGAAKPAGNRLHFADDRQGCVVDMALVGPFLVVADNRGCGGHNVSFTGVFARRGRAH